MITTDTLEAATIAAFTARHEGRPSYTWEGAAFPTQQRWRMVVWDVLTGKITSAEAMRWRYVSDFTTKTWRETPAADRFLWMRAYLACNRAMARAELEAA